jgi:hypothetical protein
MKERPPDEERPHGVIESITGRSARGGGGLPAISEMIIQNPDGTVLEARHGPEPEETATGHVAGRAVIEAGIGELCPICLEGMPDTEEHVPQEALGGRVMTLTCWRCNNKLGSHVEVHLQDWFDKAVVMYMEQEGTPGRRRVGRVLNLRAPDGSPVQLPEHGFHPDVSAMIAPGASVLTTRRPPPEHLYRLAALKHAYLASCLHLGFVPDTPSARRIRAELLAARDAPNWRKVPPGATAAELTIFRTYLPPTEPTLGLVEIVVDGEPTGEYFISLAGTVLVSWPFEDVPPLPGLVHPPPDTAQEVEAASDQTS